MVNYIVLHSHHFSWCGCVIISMHTITTGLQGVSKNVWYLKKVLFFSSTCSTDCFTSIPLPQVVSFVAIHILVLILCWLITLCSPKYYFQLPISRDICRWLCLKIWNTFVTICRPVLLLISEPEEILTLFIFETILKCKKKKMQTKVQCLESSKSKWITSISDLQINQDGCLSNEASYNFHKPPYTAHQRNLPRGMIHYITITLYP